MLKSVLLISIEILIEAAEYAWKRAKLIHRWSGSNIISKTCYIEDLGYMTILLMLSFSLYEIGYRNVGSWQNYYDVYMENIHEL